jgi:hypothetical protein
MYDSIQSVQTNENDEIVSFVSEHNEKVILHSPTSFKDLDVRIRETLKLRSKELSQKSLDFGSSDILNYPSQIILAIFRC